MVMDLTFAPSWCPVIRAFANGAPWDEPAAEAIEQERQRS